MASSALRRLMAEYKQVIIYLRIKYLVKKGVIFPYKQILLSEYLRISFLQLLTNAPEGLIAGPVSDDNYFEWDAQVSGPEGTPFEDGLFVAKLVFPQDYPLNPPTMRFVTEIFHPNIYPDGRVCISILHPPGADPLGYETSSERW